MALRNSPPAGRDPEDDAQIRELEKARLLLADMEHMEDYAREYEQFDQLNSHLPEWELECQRQTYADTYRQLIGVPPEQRELLRLELQGVIEMGNRTVDSVIASVRDQAAALSPTAGDRHPDDPFA